MKKLTICGISIAAFTIVIPTIPAPAEKTSAEFLQRVIAASCGVTLPISDKEAEHSIVLGSTETCSDIKWDGFRMATDTNHLYLHGNIARGTLYAAYDFAEKYLDYRYFADDCEVIPTDGEADVPVGLNIIDNPVFAARRTTCWQHITSAKMSSHSRLNDCTPGGSDQYGGMEPINGDCHTFDRLCPPSLYFDEHPEYYSYVIDEETGKGERRICSNSRGGAQLCLTNPDVLRIVTENVLKDLREHPEKKIAEISQCDNTYYCQCDACRAIDEEEGSPSGTIIRFVNAVAEAVEKEFPDVLVRTFAYQYSRKAPKITKARHNVLIRYCTIEACFRHALNDPNCENGSIFGPELSDWGKMAHQISIWDYVTNWACFSAPFPNLYALRNNARFFAENHAIHVFEECNYGYNGSITPELKAYLIGKLLWNPYMSLEEYDAHIDDFLSHFYGKGWREIRNVIRILQETTEHRCAGCFDAVDIGSLHFSTEYDIPPLREYLCAHYVPQEYQPTVPEHYLLDFIKHLPEVKEMYNRAYALAETDAERKHLDISRFSISYTDLFIKPNIKSQMTAEEQKAHEAEVKQLHEDKERLGMRYNLWSSNYLQR